MATYVIESWHAAEKPDQNGDFVVITGRKEGFISWCLTLFGIDPKTTIKVSNTRIEFLSASMAGNIRRIIPLNGVCSMLYGFHKPWAESVGIFFTLAWLVGALGATLGLGALSAVCGLMAGFIGAIIYYVLNQKLTLGFIENSGVMAHLEFKPSVIEGQQIGEADAGYVCQLTQFLIESHQRKMNRPSAS